MITRLEQRCDEGPRRAAETRQMRMNGDNEIDVSISKVDVSMKGIELQDREFFAAVREGREPNASVAQMLSCYRILHQLKQQLAKSA